MTPSFDTKAATWDAHADRRERARVIAEKIRSAVLSPQTKALEFGCGTGLLGFELLPWVGHLTLADPSQGMLEQVKKKIADRGATQVETWDLTNPLPARYDLIVSLMVLHHIEDTRGTTKTLADALLPGGFLCLADLDAEDGSFHTDEVVPHQGFRREDIEALLAENGLVSVSSQTGYVNKKVVNGRMMEFPVFLIIGRREPR